MDEETIITCTFIASTDKAILIEVDGVEDWIPRSQISEASEDLEDLDGLEKGDEVTITIPTWLAEDKELI